MGGVAGATLGQLEVGTKGTHAEYMTTPTGRAQARPDTGDMA